MRRSGVQVVLAAAYLAALVAIALWPTPVDRGVDVLDSWPVVLLDSALGVPRTTGYTIVETAANVLLFVPLGWLAVALVPVRWWAVVVAALVVSASIEVAQAVLRPERVATVWDVAANTAGAALGAAAAVWFLGRAEQARAA